MSDWAAAGGGLATFDFGNGLVDLPVPGGGLMAVFDVGWPFSSGTAFGNGLGDCAADGWPGLMGTLRRPTRTILDDMVNTLGNSIGSKRGKHNMISATTRF